jgi:hypothetical protein
MKPKSFLFLSTQNRWEGIRKFCNVAYQTASSPSAIHLSCPFAFVSRFCHATRNCASPLGVFSWAKAVDDVRKRVVMSTIAPIMRLILNLLWVVRTKKIILLYWIYVKVDIVHYQLPGSAHFSLFEFLGCFSYYKCNRFII